MRAIAIQGSMIGRKPENGPHGGGVNTECFTLNTIDRHATAIETEVNEMAEYLVRRLTPTECARLQGFPDKWGHPKHLETMNDDDAEFWENVRKTHAEMNGKEYKPFRTREQLLKWYNGLHKDGAEYKMWGNGIALPCANHIMENIAAIMGDTK